MRPTLLTWPGSAVIHDIKGENWQLTAGWLFDPTNPTSTRFNPLLEVRKGDYEVRDVQNIADILVDPEGARDRRDHWEKTAHALLTDAILRVLYAEADKTLHRVATFLADPARSIERTLRIMLTTNHLGTDAAPLMHPVVASVAREVLNVKAKTCLSRSTIYAYIAAGAFPAQRRLGRRRVAWLSSELKAWIISRPSQ